MKIAIFASKGYDRESLSAANIQYRHELMFYEPRLTKNTAALANGYEGVCVFVNDEVCRDAICQLAEGGTKIICTRSAGFNQIDLEAAEACGIVVARVPAYSPNAVSEFTVGLILTLGRKIHRAFNRVRENNFELDGLQGFEIRDKTIGVIGTGRIGAAVIKNLSGFGPRLLAFDSYHNPEIKHLVEYVADINVLAREADIITLHIPLTPETFHIINAETIPFLKDGVFIVNTSRGALLDTAAVVEGLKSGKIGFLAMDVYEEEGDLFFQDLSSKVIRDDVFSRLLTLPNVLVTGHQAFLTDRALDGIAHTTLANFAEFESSGQCTNALTAKDTRGN
ncbi:MAG: 2-hydroxyacid dehydrogenase [Anaerolineaceae bacterium]|nr:MAG: 2-hydroxyacid dehydrogenase [Anaerolineaceae bacterium]